MKKKIAFITDSTICLSEELRNHPDLYVVPIVIISEGKEYEDGKNLTTDKLYSIIRESKKVPSTSQPSVGTFESLYEQLQEEYESAIAIHVSKKLSGTFANSVAAKNQTGFSVEVIDSASLSYSITLLIEKGLELASQGVGAASIAETLRHDVKKSRNLILLGSLEQLYKGGRMSGAQFLLGNVLNIKPILQIDHNGELGLFQRIRSESKAVTKIVELVEKSYQNHLFQKLGIMHGNVLDKAKELKEKILQVIPNVNVFIGEISSSLAVHAGEGSIGVFWQEN